MKTISLGTFQAKWSQPRRQKTTERGINYRQLKDKLASKATKLSLQSNVEFIDLKSRMSHKYGYFYSRVIVVYSRVIVVYSSYLPQSTSSLPSAQFISPSHFHNLFIHSPLSHFISLERHTPLPGGKKQ